MRSVGKIAGGAFPARSVGKITGGVFPARSVGKRGDVLFVCMARLQKGKE